MRRFKVWTCGHYTYRLKETASRREDGSYNLPSAEHVFRDYQFSAGHEVHAPAAEQARDVDEVSRAAITHGVNRDEEDDCTAGRTAGLVLGTGR